MNFPLISVCLPLYNAGGYVEETVQSVLVQTLENWELIIVDDASTDDTAAVVERMIARLQDPRIHFEVNPNRRGMVCNWNHSAALTTGEFIKVIGQDDLLAPGCLQLQSSIMQRHPEVTVVTCALRVIGPSGKEIMRRRRMRREGVYDGAETIRRCIHSGTNMIGEPVAVLFRAATVGRHDLFERAITYCTDLDLWLRLLEHGDLYYMQTPQASYRIHQQAATRALEGEVVEDYFRLVDRVVERGHFRMTKLRRIWLALKVRALLLVRTFIYTFLARR